jgi:hypothetical protein
MKKWSIGDDEDKSAVLRKCIEDCSNLVQATGERGGIPYKWVGPDIRVRPHCPAPIHMFQSTTKLAASQPHSLTRGAALNVVCTPYILCTLYSVLSRTAPFIPSSQ